jgi:hypothetical protein
MKYWPIGWRKANLKTGSVCEGENANTSVGLSSQPVRFIHLHKDGLT